MSERHQCVASQVPLSQVPWASARLSICSYCFSDFFLSLGISAVLVWCTCMIFFFLFILLRDHRVSSIFLSLISFRNFWLLDFKCCFCCIASLFARTSIARSRNVQGVFFASQVSCSIFHPFMSLYLIWILSLIYVCTRWCPKPRVVSSLPLVCCSEWTGLFKQGWALHALLCLGLG